VGGRDRLPPGCQRGTTPRRLEWLLSNINAPDCRTFPGLCVPRRIPFGIFLTLTLNTNPSPPLTNMAIAKAQLYSLLGHSTPFDTKHAFVSSWALPPVAHACLRILLGLYVFTAIIYSYIWFSQNVDVYHLHDISEPEYTIAIASAAIGRSFSYFTYLSYYGQGFYFLVTATHGIVFARTGTTWLHSKFPPFLQLLHSLYYSCVTCFPILVTLTFWCTMYVGPWWSVTFDAWANLSVSRTSITLAAERHTE
jgi:hypothetical protein